MKKKEMRNYFLQFLTNKESIAKTNGLIILTLIILSLKDIIV
mgnify:CR=1 FL=1